MEGYIKLYRRITDTSFWPNHNATRLAIYLICSANYKDKKTSIKYREIMVRRGQVLTGRKKIALETGLSERKTRTAIHFLVMCGFMTIEPTSSFSLITIIKYDAFQDMPLTNDQRNDQQTTSKRPANDQQATTTEELKELKELKERSKAYIIPLDLADLWKTLTTGKLPAINKFTSIRKTKAVARLKETPKESEPAEYWRRIIERMLESDFCLGSKGWKADFDWLLRPDTHVKVLEGKYDNRINQTTNAEEANILPPPKPGWGRDNPEAKRKYDDLMAENELEERKIIDESRKKNA